MQLQRCTTKSIVQSRDISVSRKQINYHNVQIFYRMPCRSQSISYYVLPINHSVG